MKSIILNGAIVAILGLSSQAFADTVQFGIAGQGMGALNESFWYSNFERSMLGDNSTVQLQCLEQDQYAHKCEGDYNWHSTSEVEMPAPSSFSDPGAFDSMSFEKGVFPSSAALEPMLGTGTFTLDQQFSNVNGTLGPLSSDGSFFSTSSPTSITTSTTTSTSNTSISSLSSSTPLPPTWPMMLSALAAMALLGRVRAKRPRRNAI